MTTSTHAISTSSAPRREGSPWTGLGTVFLKETADHLGSVRMVVLQILVILVGLGAVYTAIQDVRTVSAEDPFLFLRLFTHARAAAAVASSRSSAS